MWFLDLGGEGGGGAFPALWCLGFSCWGFQEVFI